MFNLLQNVIAHKAENSAHLKGGFNHLKKMALTFCEGKLPAAIGINTNMLRVSKSQQFSITSL